VKRYAAATTEQSRFFSEKTTASVVKASCAAEAAISCGVEARLQRKSYSLEGYEVARIEIVSCEDLARKWDEAKEALASEANGQ
jgi:hypothetical protein